MRALLWKEISSFFSQLSGFLMVAVFLLTLGLLLWVFPDTNVLDFGYADLEPLFYLSPFVFMFFIPAVCMRLLADERRQGTWELLATAPLPVWKVVVAKYLAALLLIFLALLPTWGYLYSLYQLGDPVGNIDVAGFAGSWVGLFLIGAAFVAIGVLGSAFSQNQMIAFLWGVFLSFLLYSGLSALVDLQWEHPLAYYLEALSMRYHYVQLSRGVIDMENVAYFTGLIVLVLGISIEKLERA